MQLRVMIRGRFAKAQLSLALAEVNISRDKLNTGVLLVSVARAQKLRPGVFLNESSSGDCRKVMSSPGASQLCANAGGASLAAPFPDELWI
jgi:hypothetical protein